MKEKRKVIVIIILSLIAFVLFKVDQKLNRKEKGYKVNAETDEDVHVDTLEVHKEVGLYTIEDPEYWIERIVQSDLLLMNSSEIKDYNKDNFHQLDYLVDIENHKDTIEKTQLEEIIKMVSKKPAELRFDSQGNVMDEGYFNELMKNLNLESIPHKVSMKYGVTVNRTVLRTFPTYEPSYKKEGDIEFDRFMETAIYPWEPLAIYIESADGEWYFGRIYNYLGWIPKKDVAIGDKENIFYYINWEPFLVVIDRQVNLDGVILDMGVRIPLIGEDEEGYKVLMPTRSEEGKFEVLEKKLPTSKSFYKGYLPYTKANIIKQGFKFLGEEYGWGGMNNTRDCSALIMDIHRTFGIKLPRNSIEQGMDSLGKVYDKGNFPPASVLYMPGHIMLYLGEDEGIGYILHQVAGYYEESGEGLKYVEAMKTIVTPITIKTSTGKTYLENIVICKEFVKK